MIIIVLGNLICYAAHEKSLFHGHLRLPKVLLVSNRCPTMPSSLGAPFCSPQTPCQHARNPPPVKALVPTVQG